MTDPARCPHHKAIPLVEDRCLLCEAREMFRKQSAPTSLMRSFCFADEEADFSAWLIDECPDEYAVRHWLALFEQTPGELVRRWRYTFGPVAERLTVVVRECSYCHAFIGVKEWRGKDAHPEAWTATGGVCDDCALAKGLEIDKKTEEAA